MGAKIISKKVANNANDDDRTNPVMGSPALVKVREAVMGPHGQNLNDLIRLDGIELKN